MMQRRVIYTRNIWYHLRDAPSVERKTKQVLLPLLMPLLLMLLLSPPDVATSQNEAKNVSQFAEKQYNLIGVWGFSWICLSSNDDTPGRNIFSPNAQMHSAEGSLILGGYTVRASGRARGDHGDVPPGCDGEAEEGRHVAREWCWCISGGEGNEWKKRVCSW